MQIQTIKFDAYSLWLVLICLVFFSVSFLGGPQALIAISLLIGYPHLFFTSYYLKKENFSFLFPLLVVITFAAFINLNVSLVLTAYLFLQPIHYNYQNWLLTSPLKNVSSGVFWMIIMGFQYGLIYANLKGFKIPLEAVFFVIGLLGLVGIYLLKNDQKSVFMGLLFLLFLSFMSSKESLLAMAAGWHGLQYMLNIVSVNEIERKVKKHFLFGLASIAALYSFSASYFVAEANNWAIVIILSLNLTHYLFDFIFMGRDYLNNESQAKSIYF